jgi:hypothetical protein
MPIKILAGSLVVDDAPTNGIDLVAGSRAQAILSAGGVTLSATQASILPMLITAASREMIRFCGNRPLAAMNFTEILTPEGTRQDRGEPATARLGRFPVLSITRCATGRTTALTITNSAADEATVVFVATGDVDFDNLIYTGLTLSRSVAGVVTTDTVTWTTASPYTTIASVAASINALGGGWSATATTGGSPDVSRFPAAYLVGAREPKDATGSATARLEVYGTPYASYSIERSTGLLSCSGLSWGRGFGGWDQWGGWGESAGGGYYGWPSVEIRYRAGFETVPEQLQLCCAEVVQLMFGRLVLDPALASETTDKYTWTAHAKDALANVSDGARATLNYFKDWRV